MSKELAKNLKFGAISALLIAIIFGAGLYIGSKNNIPFFGQSEVSASENADLTLFWKVWNTLDEKYVTSSATSTAQDRIYGAIEGMVNSLDDPYTVFLPPKENEEFAESLAGNFSGVGMEVGMQDEQLTVIAPLKDSPAEKAGIRTGDVVIQVDGKSIVGFSIDESINLIRGEQGTAVTLTVLREDEAEPLKIEIVRDVITIPVIETELRDDGVFVISLFNFNGTATREFRDALREFLLSKTDKLVLDLRGNPGGYLDAAVDISSWFLPEGKVIVTEDFGETREDKVFRSKGFNLFNNNLKMVVLVDKGSASASEIVAGALQAHGIAELVGTETFGKGSVQELVNLDNKTSLKVTIARWLTPTGDSISEGGLTPDHEIKVTAEDIENQNDVQLQKAVEVLLSK